MLDPKEFIEIDDTEVHWLGEGFILSGVDGIPVLLDGETRAVLFAFMPRKGDGFMRWHQRVMDE
jgi:hypothetical protein